MNSFYNVILNISYLSLPLIVILLAYCHELAIIWSTCLFIVIILFYVISILSLKYAITEGERFNLKYETFEQENANVLTVISTTLIPLACKQFNMPLKVLIFLCVLGTFVFIIVKPFIYNLVFIFLKFNIYKITTSEGGTYTLLTKNKIINNYNKINVLKINDYVLVQE